MLYELLNLSKEVKDVEVLIYYAESEPLYVWSRRKIDAELVQQVYKGIKDLVGSVKGLKEAIWEGKRGVYVLGLAGKGYILAILSGYQSVSIYRKALQKLFNKF